MSRRKVTLVPSGSPYEQGELASSSPEITMKTDDYSDEEDHQEEEVEDHNDSDHDMDYGEDDQDGLEIKPPPVPVKKKDKHKHKRKDDKKKDKSKTKHRDEDKDRHRDARGRDREFQRDHRDDRPRGVPDRYSHDAKAFDRKQNSKDRERELKEKLIREQEKREKSRLERERLERLEREKNRDRRLREERERREQEKRRRKEQERKLHIQKKQREEERMRKEKAKTEQISRARSRSRERHGDSRSVKSRLGPRVSEKGRGERSPEGRISDSKSYSPVRSEADISHPKDGIPDSAQSPSEEESEDSESDSGSGTESSSESEETSEEEHKEGEEEEERESHEDKKHLDQDQTPQNMQSDLGSTLFAKSKFDDHSDNESDVGSAGHDAHQDQDGFLQDTPPLSPIELKPDLPPYFPAIQGCRNVEEFKCLNRIEEGTYGVVYRAHDKKTDEIVALKKLKMEKEKEGFPITSLREINTLLKAQHTNIVTVREIVVGSNMDKIYIVMDYVEHDLKSLIETMKQPFLMGEVKTLLKQLLRGVQHLHDNWIIHRDLKTSNLLLSHKGILKIGDFGLAREYGEPLKHYTPIVVTLWYRAPELLLGTKEYSTPIDMWSVGCIMAEFLTMKAIWQGKSDIDQLQKIFKDLGTPTEKIWPGVSELPGMKKCTFTEHPYNTLRNKFGQYLSDSGFNLLNRFLTYSPSRRITGSEALSNEFFSEAPLPVDPSMFPTWPAKSEQSRKHISSPKPPSGGKAYSKLLDDGDDAIAGFHLTNAAKGVSATGPGFSLKF